MFLSMEPGKKIDSSSAIATPDSTSSASTAVVTKPHGKGAVSSPTSMAPVEVPLMLFRDVSLGPHEAALRFCLIHFWEAINPRTKKLIGQEMLLIDEEGTAIQGFVPAGRVGRYDLLAGSVYKLTNFFGSRSKDIFSVADHNTTITFSWNSHLSDPENHPVPIQEDRFRYDEVSSFIAFREKEFVEEREKLIEEQTIYIDEMLHLKRKLCLWSCS